MLMYLISLYVSFSELIFVHSLILKDICLYVVPTKVLDYSRVSSMQGFSGFSQIWFNFFLSCPLKVNIL